MEIWEKVWWLALAGSLGTLARYGLSGLVHRYFNGSFPWGTAAVNVLGCFRFGMVWQLGQQRVVLRADVRFIVLVRFMGALTTLSTFVFETDNLLRDGQWWSPAPTWSASWLADCSLYDWASLSCNGSKLPKR